MPTLAFLGRVDPAFVPPVLRSAPLPNDPAALGRLQTCACVPKEYIDWLDKSFSDSMKRNGIEAFCVPPAQLFFFALMVRPNMSLAELFPTCTALQRDFVHRFSLAIRELLSKKNDPQAVARLQTVVYRAYDEHVRAVHEEAYEAACAKLGVPVLLLPEAIIPGLLVLRTLGWRRLPKAFCCAQELPELAPELAVAVALRRLPAHVPGFEPEREFAQTVFGDADRAALHPMFVVRSCAPAQAVVLWKMLGWPTERAVMRGLARAAGAAEKTRGEDVRVLLRALVGGA